MRRAIDAARASRHVLARPQGWAALWRRLAMVGAQNGRG
jgi:hypothetical protein